MALIRSLNTAVTGLRAQQLRIELVGNNIANVDTTAFKSSRAEFSTILSQLMSFGMAPDGFLGGIDPTQVGLGTFVGGTRKNFNQGPVELTGVSSDLAIVGDGFFVLRDSTGREVYTRDGSFSINPANLLHDAVTGYVVQGYGADENFQIQSGGPLRNIEIPLGVSTIARATTLATLEGNLNSSGAVASSGTRILSDALYDLSRPNQDLISGSNPLGLKRADSTTLLQDLVMSLGDFKAFDGSSAGTAGSFNYVFPQLQINPVGLEVKLSAEKGDRSLPQQAFVVGDAPPTGGTTLGDLVGFLRNSLGIADGLLDGSEEIEHTYSFARKNPVTGEELNGTIGPGDVANLGTIVDLGADLRGVRPGDYLRFISGQAAGQIAEIQLVSDSNGDGIPDTLTLRTDGFNSLSQVAAEGDAYVIQAPAGVRVAEDDPLAVLRGLTPGAVSASGPVSTFTLTDPSVTDLTLERGLRANAVVEYLSGGARVRGTVSQVAGNTVTIAFPSGATGAPDAGTDFTFSSPSSGTIEVAGNVGTANGLSHLQFFAGGSLVSIFENPPLAEATGESLTTTVTAYDSLGTPREVTLTFVYQSSSVNGPNVFRYFAESADDSDHARNVGSGTILFDSNGQYLGTGTPGETIYLDLEASGAQPGGVISPFNFQVDFSRLTQFATDDSEVVLREQDGFRSGTLRDFAVAEDGVIVGVYDNGLTRTLGQVAMCRFPNPNGLVDLGSNVYEASTNSGAVQTGAPGTFGRGMIRGGSLEESNVDLAEQFSELLIGQRAFQANAKTITTSDQLLQELVNLL
jgi:flagellar hook protein FlgE